MKKILLISTGGTMSMEVERGGELDTTHFIQEIFQYVPDIGKIAEIKLVRPFTLDSANVGIPQWIALGQLIYENMHNYDGFVIIHGTDTMSFTACALSYMLVNLPKPVILTGSQRPLAALRTDARSNLVQAVELATKSFPEVCVCFNNKLYRGNRTKKVSVDGFDAFASPNFPCLASIGLHIERVTPHRKPTGLLRLEPRFDQRVMALKSFPSLPSPYWKVFLDTDVQILLLEVFGAGNLPTTQTDWIDLVQSFSDSGRLVVICSHAMEGTCELNLYEGGQKAAQAGAISAGDMTFEATVVKAMFLLGMFNGDAQLARNYFNFSIAGEISDNEGELLL